MLFRSGTVVNPLWVSFLSCLQPGERSKVMAFRCTSSTHFMVVNRLDLPSNYHTLTLDIHAGADSFRAYNLYHNAHSNNMENNNDQLSQATRCCSLSYITSIEIDPLIPTVIGSNFNMHVRA